MNDLEFVGQELGRRNLVEVGHLIGRNREKHGVRRADGCWSSEHDQVIATDRNEDRVACPVRADDADRLGIPADTCCLAGLVDARCQLLARGREVNDPGPTRPSPAASDQAEIRRTTRGR